VRVGLRTDDAMAALTARAKPIKTEKILDPGAASRDSARSRVGDVDGSESFLQKRSLLVVKKANEHTDDSDQCHKNVQASGGRSPRGVI